MTMVNATSGMYVEGLEMLARLYWNNPDLPRGPRAQQINLHRYGGRAISPADQIRLAIAVIEEMDAPEIELGLNRSHDSAWLRVRGHFVDLPVTVEMFADDVCERDEKARRKRDRWITPPQLVSAVAARTPRVQ